MKHYYGEYDETGYTIWEADTPDPVYSAGNHKLDSFQGASIGSPEAMDLHAIGQACEKTGMNIAEENGGQWRGGEYIGECAI
jgi:hypothetical protein